MARLALCLVLQEIGGGPVDPGFGVGGIGGGAFPDNALPGGGHPWFPGHMGGPHPDQGLPGGGGHPSQGLPGGGHVGNRPPGSMPGLPTHPIYHPDKPVPPGHSPGAGLWVVAYVPGKGFEWVAVTPGVPDKPQPPTNPDVPTIPVDPAHPDQGLPPSGAKPDQGLPPTAAPKK